MTPNAAQQSARDRPAMQVIDHRAASDGDNDSDFSSTNGADSSPILSALTASITDNDDEEVTLISSLSAASFTSSNDCQPHSATNERQRSSRRPSSPLLQLNDRGRPSLQGRATASNDLDNAANTNAAEFWRGFQRYWSKPNQSQMVFIKRIANQTINSIADHSMVADEDETCVATATATAAVDDSKNVRNVDDSDSDDDSDEDGEFSNEDCATHTHLALDALEDLQSLIDFDAYFNQRRAALLLTSSLNHDYPNVNVCKVNRFYASQSLTDSHSRRVIELHGLTEDESSVIKDYLEYQERVGLPSFTRADADVSGGRKSKSVEGEGRTVTISGATITSTNTSASTNGQCDVACGVCGSPEIDIDDAIIYCDRCNVAVHQKCYALPSIPDGAFFCQPCLYVRRRLSLQKRLGIELTQAHLNVRPRCIVCYQRGGVMRECHTSGVTKNDSKSHAKKFVAAFLSTNTDPSLAVYDRGPSHHSYWAHLVCCNTIPELSFDVSDLVIGGYESLDKERFKMRCSLCKLANSGACAQCIDPRCVTAFHPYCALSRGLELKVMASYHSRGVDDDNSDQHVIFCHRHRTTNKLNLTFHYQADDGTDYANVINADSEDNEDDSDQDDCEYDEMLAVIRSDASNQLLSLPRSPSHLSAGPGYTPSMSSCCVCRVTNSLHQYDSHQSMLCCVQCSMKVHTECYGAYANSDSDSNTDFLCRVCESKQQSLAILNKRLKVANPTAPPLTVLPPYLSSVYTCCICLSSAPGLKQTSDRRWCHISCTSFIHELYFRDSVNAEMVDGVDTAYKVRARYHCIVCDKRGGVCAVCSEVGCNRAYHIQCGLRKGFEMRELSEAEGAGAMSQPFVTLCDLHSARTQGGIIGGSSKNKSLALSSLSQPSSRTKHHSHGHGEKRRKPGKPPKDAASTPSSQAPALAPVSPPSTLVTIPKESACSICSYGLLVDTVSVSAIAITNRLITCHSCGVVVHSLCYGVDAISRASEWKCRVCAYMAGEEVKSFSQSKSWANIFKNKSHSLTGSSQPNCVICLTSGGPLVRTSDSLASSNPRWCHINCANFTPELYFEDAVAMNAIAGIDKALKTRRRLECVFCHRQGGAPIQCAHSHCEVAFHAQCAHDSGCVTRELVNPKPNHPPFVAYCQQHSQRHRSKNCDNDSGSKDSRCDVCIWGMLVYEDATAESRVMFQCSHCQLRVHQGCYDASMTADDRTDEWLCKLCRVVKPKSKPVSGCEAVVTSKLSRVRVTAPPPQSVPALPTSRPQCVMCLDATGAMKPTIDGRWCHLSCAFYLPQLYFLDTARSEPIDGVQAALNDNSGRTCVVCRMKGGACLRCSHHGCSVSYHVTCAHRSEDRGFELREVSDKKGKRSFVSHCPRHSHVALTKGLSTAKVNEMLKNRRKTSQSTIPMEIECIDVDSDSDDSSGGKPSSTSIVSSGSSLRVELIEGDDVARIEVTGSAPVGDETVIETAAPQESDWVLNEPIAKTANNEITKNMKRRSSKKAKCNEKRDSKKRKASNARDSSVTVARGANNADDPRDESKRPKKKRKHSKKSKDVVAETDTRSPEDADVKSATHSDATVASAEPLQAKTRAQPNRGIDAFFATSVRARSSNDDNDMELVHAQPQSMLVGDADSDDEVADEITVAITTKDDGSETETGCDSDDTAKCEGSKAATATPAKARRSSHVKSNVYEAAAAATTTSVKSSILSWLSGKARTPATASATPMKLSAINSQPTAVKSTSAKKTSTTISKSATKTKEPSAKKKETSRKSERAPVVEDGDDSDIEIQARVRTGRSKRHRADVEQADSSEELFCVCHAPYVEGELMVGCDGPCGDWYHPACIGIPEQQVSKIPSYYCKQCSNEPEQPASTSAGGRKRQATSHDE